MISLHRLPSTVLVLILLAAKPVWAQFPGKHWETLSTEETVAAGWDRDKLNEAREFAATLKTDAVMIVTRGKILDAWGAVDQKFNVHSIRKSFLSALCGIQVAEGRLDLNATMGQLGIDDNEPTLSEIEKGATVLQLLQARSGIYHPALYETKGMKARRPERFSHAPGAFWYYNNWDFNALGTIYEKVAQTGIYEDFQRRIATPVGMEDYTVTDGKYVTGKDSIHRAYPFRMTARDMARFGLLFLRQGKWRESQIVPAAWVKDSVTPWSSTGSGYGYGYLWWMGKDGSFSAQGAGGHHIVVIPKRDVVIVHRVNTDISGRSVASAEFVGLVRRILAAQAFE